MYLFQVGEKCVELIKKQSWFPYRSGWLKYHATFGEPENDNTYVITFSNKIAKMNPNSKSKSEYITYLEEGTSPHDIPGAFGRSLPFGIGGRFDGKFHPGSQKHVGFIKNKSVNTIVKYICSRYNGELR